MLKELRRVSCSIKKDPTLVRTFKEAKDTLADSKCTTIEQINKLECLLTRLQEVKKPS